MVIGISRNYIQGRKRRTQCIIVRAAANRLSIWEEVVAGVEMLFMDVKLATVFSGRRPVESWLLREEKPFRR
jgi:hypothetical protein